MERSVRRRPRQRIELGFDPIRLLSDERVEAVHEASLEVLRDTGVEFLSPRTLDFLDRPGVEVDRETGIARFDPDFVAETIKTAPSRFRVHARDPARDVEIGGRAVIYQPAADYRLLPDELRYRHVRYELDQARAERAVDWTWEREWRIRTGRLAFAPEEVTLVCPTTSWVDRLVDAHVDRVRNDVWMVGEVVESEFAASVVERFPWHSAALEDFDVPLAADVTFEE